jgi:hypothetical protein
MCAAPSGPFRQIVPVLFPAQATLARSASEERLCALLARFVGPVWVLAADSRSQSRPCARRGPKMPQRRQLFPNPSRPAILCAAGSGADRCLVASVRTISERARYKMLPFVGAHYSYNRYIGQGRSRRSAVTRCPGMTLYPTENTMMTPRIVLGRCSGMGGFRDFAPSVPKSPFLCASASPR